MEFPFDLNCLHDLRFSTSAESLTHSEVSALTENIELLRNVVVFSSALSHAKGLGGHTGGPYDVVPEFMILDAFIRGGEAVYPIVFDEAGHRALVHYVFAVVRKEISADKLWFYRDANEGVYGHPERDDERGVHFSSGRLGHMWPYVNGVAHANPDLAVFMLGSDGSQQEGNSAEAARWAVARSENIKILIDSNNTTITGKPTTYLSGFKLEETLGGHGLPVSVGDGEDFGSLFARIRHAILDNGPIALVDRREMAPGIRGLEGRSEAHEAISTDLAIEHLEARNHITAAEYLKSFALEKQPRVYRGVSTEFGSCRKQFGIVLSELVGSLTDRNHRVMVVDCDLEGSTGIRPVRESFPEIYVQGGIMERGNFSAAAGFGSEPGKQGIISTYAAFLEMLVSEISMARLNKANVIAHFSHAGVDQLVDNTCHYGTNVFLADSGPSEISELTRLYYPADPHQMRAILSRIFREPGLRFMFSPRISVPIITDSAGNDLFDVEKGYEFTPGIDDIVRTGTDAYIVSYGELLAECIHVSEELRLNGKSVGVINKSTLNVVDESALKKAADSGVVIVVESQNRQTGLGIRYGTWLSERGLTCRYRHLGTTRSGQGGLLSHLKVQGLTRDEIKSAVLELV